MLSKNGQAAIYYAEHGLAVYAPAWGSKIPNKGSKGILGKTSSTATRDVDVLTSVYEEKPGNNVAIRLEMCEPKLVSIDCDGAEAHPTDEEKEKGIIGEDGWDILDCWLAEHSIALPDTWTVRTATGGLNRLYRLPEGADMPKDAIAAMTRVDLLGDGHAQIMPPSQIKGKAGIYHFEGGRSPDDLDIAVLPQAFLDYWNGVVAQRDGAKKRERKEREIQKKIDAVENGTIAQSKRNKTLFSYACSLRAKGVPEGEIWERVRKANAERCQIPLEDSEVERIVNSALRYEPGTSRNPYDPPTQAEIAEDMRTNPELFACFGQNVLDSGYYAKDALSWSKDDSLRRWDDADEAYLYSYEQERLGTNSREDVKGAFKIRCAENRFNPIVDMLEALPPWDGKPRAAFMLWALFSAEDNLYTQRASLTWMRGAVRRAYEPGCKFDYTIVLKGAQGIKKSMTGRCLAMREEFFCETITDITNAKTTSEQTGGKWIVELGELSGLKGKELEAVKAALTAQKTTVRQAYAHFPIDQPRSCVFLATTNENDFLTDPTGNRRFLPVECAVTDDRKGWDLADVEELRGFIEQAWAEILHRYKEAKNRAKTEDEFLRLYPLVLSDEAEALAEEKRDSSSVEDTRIGVIEAWLEDEGNWKRRICTRMVAEKALHLDDEALERNKWVMKDIAQILDANFPNWVRNPKKQRCGDYGTTRVWDYVPTEVA